MMNDFLDNLAAHQYQKMHKIDEKIRDELESVTVKLKGNIKEFIRSDNTGRQSKIIEIEYDVKETKG